MTNQLVLCDLDSHKQVGYAVSLRNGNFENDFSAVIVDTKIEVN